MWVCGLKHVSITESGDIPVAPYVGVWIETLICLNRLLHSWSHPMWVCGLKQANQRLSFGRVCRTLCGCVD